MSKWIEDIKKRNLLSKRCGRCGIRESETEIVKTQKKGFLCLKCLAKIIIQSL